MATIQQILGKVNPNLYAENGKELLKKYKSIENIPAEEVKPKSLAEHKLIYDSMSDTLEPIYFFILDLMNDLGLETEKLIDNFVSSPGSGHFAELGQRATIMQQQATKILGDVNAVLKSILNIIYDLKDFRIRLQYYDDLKSKEKEKREAALLSLKQIWLDKVDITRGNSGIKAMSFQGGFQTLLDAFLAVKDEKEADKLDLNERVKRIVKSRIQEFNTWLKNSEQELRKRYELEKTYLRSQVNSLKLYSRWVKPYLKAAFQLEMKETRSPDLIKTFNTIILELTLLGKEKINVEKAAASGDLPSEYGKRSILRTIKKEYFNCVLVDFYFRGIPQRISQQAHYVFGGRTEVTFRAYSLTNEELKLFEEELKKSDLEDALKLIEGATSESLDKLQEEINFFLEETEEKKEREVKDTSNPFFALFGVYEKKNEKGKKEKERKAINPENFIEKQIRELSSEKAKDLAFNLFDLYKKAHGMPSYT